MRLLHYKQTPLAAAPDALSDALRRYHGIESRVVTDPADVPKIGDTIVHFHNKQHPVRTACPRLIQYHSPPGQCDLRPEAPALRLVVAQYQALLPEFRACAPVRNVINFEQPLYDLCRAPLRIGFAPSWRGKSRCGDKGVPETLAVLDRLKARHGVDYDLIENVPLEECLRRKANCSILIDECKTGSYHRSTLENLALGKVAVCWIRPEIQALVRSLVGDRLPVVNVPLSGLYERLLDLALNCSAHGGLEAIGWESRRWMAGYWHPRDVSAELVAIYRRLAESLGEGVTG